MGEPVPAWSSNTLLTAICRWRCYPGRAVRLLLPQGLSCAARARPSPTLKDELAGMWAMCTSSKNTALAGIGLGIFAGLHMWVTGALREHYGIFNFGELLSGHGLRERPLDPGHRVRPRLLVHHHPGGPMGRLGVGQARHGHDGQHFLRSGQRPAQPPTQRPRLHVHRHHPGRGDDGPGPARIQMENADHRDGRLRDSSAAS
jgi:hypothetical protein